MTTPNPDTPIERAARALYEGWYARAPTEGATYDALEQSVKAELAWIAKTVLTAIRTPDEGMKTAGAISINRLDGCCGSDAVLPCENCDKPNWAGCRVLAAGAFTIMIDHLIASGEQ